MNTKIIPCKLAKPAQNRMPKNFNTAKLTEEAKVRYQIAQELLNSFISKPVKKSGIIA